MKEEGDDEEHRDDCADEQSGRRRAAFINRRAVMSEQAVAAHGVQSSRCAQCVSVDRAEHRNNGKCADGRVAIATGRGRTLPVCVGLAASPRAGPGRGSRSGSTPCRP